MEIEAKESTKLLETSARMEEKIELLRINVSKANDMESWLSSFAKLLEDEIPFRLMYSYNATTPNSPGCLTKYPEAKVECWSVPQEEERVPLDECELDFEWDI